MHGCVCMYVCMYVCIYVYACMHICIYYKYVCINVCVYIGAFKLDIQSFVECNIFCLHVYTDKILSCDSYIISKE